MVLSNKRPPESKRALSLPSVSNLIVPAAGNLIKVFVSPVCTILSAIDTSPVKVPVVPETVPTLIFGAPLNPVALPVTFPVNAPTNVVDVVTPVKNPSPSLLKVIPLPTTIPVSYTHLTLPTILRV